MTRRPFALGVALVLVLASPSASASDPAVDLFNDGLALLKKGDAAGACAQFRASGSARVTLGALARIAECDERDGHLVLAREDWRRALTLAQESRDDRAAAVESAIARLDAALPKAHIVVPSPPPLGLRIELDGAEVTGADLVPLDPGIHKLTTAAPRKHASELTFEARADGKAIELLLPTLVDDVPPLDVPQAPPATAPPPSVPRADAVSGPPVSLPEPAGAGERRVESHGLAPVRIAGIATGAVGTVVVVIGGICAAAASAEKSVANCNGLACPNSIQEETLQSAKTEANVATALLSVGGVGVAAGIAMILLAPSHTPSRAPAPVTSSLTVVPHVDRSSLGVALEGRF